MNKGSQMRLYSYIFILIISLIILFEYSIESYSSPISFHRQTITDKIKDWTFMSISDQLAFDKIECQDQLNFNPYDIIAIDYFSHGNALNATLWLSSSIEEPDVTSIASFEMLIDITSVYDAGQDYLVKVEWNKMNKTWDKTVQSISPSTGKNNVIDFGEFKTIEKQTYNTKDLFKSGKNYVDLSVTLDSLSFPDYYSIIFFSSNSYYTKTGYFCKIIDISDQVQVPPPDISLSLSQNSISLFPNDEKKIEIIMESSTKLNSYVVLSTSKINGIESKFTPNETSIYSSGLANSELSIKALNNAKPRLFTLPIYSIITFPTALKNQLSNEIANNTLSANIFKYSNLTVEVLKPLTFTEKFSNAWNDLGIALSGFISLTITIIGALFTLTIYILRKKWKNHN